MLKKYSQAPLNVAVTYTVFKNPIGLTGLIATSKGLVRIINKLTSEKSLEKYLSQITRHDISKSPTHFKDLIKQFSLYFKGDLKIFDYPLDMSLGTPFQQNVWKKLLTIPYGDTRSYQWLARAIKNPLAARAVGNANGKNPLSIIVPCHRVIRVNGEMGGYTGGVSIKRFLLKHEQGN